MSNQDKSTSNITVKTATKPEMQPMIPSAPTAGIHSISLKGLRNENEDKHSVFINLNGNDKTRAHVNYLAVYDGHGGKFVSKFLEKNLPNFFTDKRVHFPLTKKYVHDVYTYVQKVLREKYHEKALHCGSTCVSVTHFKKNDVDYINVLNTGDSRCIICRDNFGINLTKDHKPDWPEERSRIEALGGKIYFDGDDWRIKDLSVSRAFGDIDAEPFVTNMPDIFRYKLEKSDKFIVIACDGLWDVMDNQSVVNFILAEAYDKTTNARNTKNINIAKKLAEHALERGSTDNLTVLIYFLQ